MPSGVDVVGVTSPFAHRHGQSRFDCSYRLFLNALLGRLQLTCVLVPTLFESSFLLRSKHPAHNHTLLSNSPETNRVAVFPHA